VIRRTIRRGLTLGLLGGVVVAAVRSIRNRCPVKTEPTALPPSELPVAPLLIDPWVEPVEGACPSSHPVKAKLSSRIFHVPGGANYPRTQPDRCYLDPAAAEADGLRPAKR
jgi:hypothetical protein